MRALDDVTKDQIRDDIPQFREGDTVKVNVRVVEYKELKGGKVESRERVQAYEGVVIARHNRGISSSFTVRKISNGVGVERIFPINLPAIQKIEVNKHGRVRRARIFYFRGLTGKKGRIQERRR